MCTEKRTYPGFHRKAQKKSVLKEKSAPTLVSTERHRGNQHSQREAHKPGFHRKAQRKAAFTKKSAQTLTLVGRDTEEHRALAQ
eukprot:548947-Pelagomonas_calceolata.AAC.3